MRITWRWGLLLSYYTTMHSILPGLHKARYLENQRGLSYRFRATALQAREMPTKTAQAAVAAAFSAGVGENTTKNP